MYDNQFGNPDVELPLRFIPQTCQSVHVSLKHHQDLNMGDLFPKFSTIIVSKHCHTVKKTT